jgi:hypothetical protein
MNIDVRKWIWYWKFTWTVLAISFGVCLWTDSPRALLACLFLMTALVIPGAILRVGRKNRGFYPGCKRIYETFIGHVDKGDGEVFRCTTFRNADCDDPRLVVFERSDFDREPGDGEWFAGTIGSNGIRLMVKSPEEILPGDFEKEYERLMKELPDDF